MARRLVTEGAGGAPVSPAALARALRRELPGVVGDAELAHLIKVMRTELVGAGPVAELLADPETTDVVINGPDQVLVDRGAGWEDSGIRLADDAAVQRLARRLAVAAGRRLDDAHPWVDARMADGTRVHAVLAPVAVSGTCLSLRVLRPVRHDLAALQQRGFLPGVGLTLLRAVLQARLATLVSGGTGSGKTTLLGALIGALPPGERIVVVEDAEELRPPHPHVVRLVARPANVEGAGAVTLRDLVRQALRMRPDRLIVGEVRGGEVVELLAALNTGHDGGAGTVHANTAADVPDRVEALAIPAGLSRAACQAQLAAAVQVVLHVRRSAGHRWLAEIAVLARDGSGRVVVESAARDGVPGGPGWPRLVELLTDRGVEVPAVGVDRVDGGRR
ncbi:TadA family conjugal transfer-associated ATPase [Nakamurella sp. YIM 132084]|uniref:TadA family conjugal transfer-associated ATPase n=1 Tax=Nakamurella leprariae TaxID=2803911 RepID=A0A938YGI2_9ACTN|nr:TadA family conjugal transfer-associated ATPase [Nakamurella leprariae]